MEIKGTCDEKFKPLSDILSAQLDSGDELGASVALVIEAEPVVDIWGGWADEARTTPWEKNTLTNVWSTTKTMTNLCALALIERGCRFTFAYMMNKMAADIVGNPTWEKLCTALYALV